LNLTDVQAALNAHGFPCGRVDGVLGPNTKAAVARFQQAYANGPWLTVDAVPGPKTQAALDDLPYLSPHFSVAEVASHGNGDCYVSRDLLAALEQLRTFLNMPLHVIDAYRDPAHNTSVGGEKDSMHLYGLAADIPPVCSWQAVARLGLFSGIGDRHGMISHVDLRHLAGQANHTPNATPQAPARWTY
jgi:zinc D-Ala-D-Ala carboxypeptidase